MAKLRVYLLNLLLVAPTLLSNSLVAEGLMQLEQALSSQTLIDAEALIPKGDFQAVYQLL